VLEQSESVIRYQGAGVLLYPQTLRLLDQIGIYEKAEKDFVINHTQTDLLTCNGRVIKSTPLWSILGERWVFFSIQHRSEIAVHLITNQLGMGIRWQLSPARN
jgi:hypothetical protein